MTLETIIARLEAKKSKKYLSADDVVADSAIDVCIAIVRDELSKQPQEVVALRAEVVALTHDIAVIGGGSATIAPAPVQPDNSIEARIAWSKEHSHQPVQDGEISDEDYKGLLYAIFTWGEYIRWPYVNSEMQDLIHSIKPYLRSTKRESGDALEALQQIEQLVYREYSDIDKAGKEAIRRLSEIGGICRKAFAEQARRGTDV